MKIKEYVQKMGLTCEQAANQLNCHPKYLRTLWSGRKKPGPKMERALKEWSNGALCSDIEVPEKDLCCPTCKRLLGDPKSVPSDLASAFIGFNLIDSNTTNLYN
jgi:hypothetical protein